MPNWTHLFENANITKCDTKMNSKVTLFACILVFTIIADKVTADDTVEIKKVPKLYEEIGCNKVDKSGLPSFECPSFETYATNKCYLKGKTFNVGEDVEGDILPSCRASCKCLQIGDGPAKIECANVECPENFGGRDWSCVSVYDNLKQCCRSGEICDKAKISAMETCEVEGKSYRVGERIYPEDACYECLCAENFNNKTTIAQNPNCARIDCGIELRLSEFRSGCVPVYYKTPTCCPIDFKGLTAADDAIDSTPASGDNLTCKFGDLTLKHGERLKTKECMTCECSVPPYITCIKTNC